VEPRLKKTDYGAFRGIERPLFPEIGSPGLRIFTGLERGIFDSLLAQNEPSAGVPPAGVDVNLWQGHLRPNMSVSRTGACMIVEGLDF